MIQEFIINFIIYSVIITILIFAAMIPEYKDLICPDGFYQKDMNICGDGKGKWYDGTQKNQDDDINTCFKKIKKASKSITHHVSWRFAYIISFFITTSVYLVVLKRIPPAYEFSLFIIISFLFVYFSQKFYELHYYSFPQQNIFENVELIEEKLKYH
jgi:hypothetical protein